MELDKLEKLLAMLQAKGVKSYKDREVELEFADQPESFDGPFEIDVSGIEFPTEN